MTVSTSDQRLHSAGGASDTLLHDGAGAAMSRPEVDVIPEQALGLVHTIDNGESDPAPSSHGLFVTPTKRGDGLRATIRGHVLELADPTGRLAPTPDDLLVVSIASELAWCTRRFLRDHALTDDVSVSTAWRTVENPPGPADISVTVALAETAERVGDALLVALEARVAARSLDDLVSIHLRCQG